jgi:hypothetical protein
MWMLKDFDEVIIDWNFTWEGTFGLAVIVSWELQWMRNYSLKWEKAIDEAFLLAPIKSKLPWDTLLYVYNQWNISSKVEYVTKKYSFIDKIKKQLFSAEAFAPYSINLRYGKKIGDTSIVYIAYISFIVIISVLIFFTKVTRENFLFVSILVFWIVASINLISFFHLYTSASTWYIEKQKYHNMWDYFVFTQNVREIIGLDNDVTNNSCTYYSECTNHWPFCYYWKTLYMQPCSFTEKIDDAEYILLHRKEIPEKMKHREILYPFQGSYLLK